MSDNIFFQQKKNNNNISIEPSNGLGSTVKYWYYIVIKGATTQYTFIGHNNTYFKLKKTLHPPLLPKNILLLFKCKENGKF